MTFISTGRLEEPRKVQLFDRPLNGKVPVPQKDVKLEFTPLVPDKPSLNLILKNNNNGPTPLINPRPGDYLLNRTHSTEGIASKISLELKKRYLLGPSGLAGNVRKSGSASTLDTRFKSVVDQISEHQKLLNPAPEPSPTMQAILQGADKLRSSPTILPSPILLDRKQKEVPGIAEFGHICNLKNKETIDPKDNPITLDNKSNNSVDKVEDVNKSVNNQESKENIDNQTGENDDCRPRSPVHETSIIVPEFPRSESKDNVPETNDIETDSLSSDMSSSEEESDHKSQGQITVPPKVEIHNSRGELMEDDVAVEEVKLTESQKTKPLTLDILKRNIPDVCPNIDILPSLKVLNHDDIQLVSKNIDKDGGTFNKIISVPRPLSEKAVDRGQILKQVSTPAELFASDNVVVDNETSGHSSPSSPISVRDEESFRNESLIAALTETELSDWARDEDAVVSENFDDVEFNINPQFITFRKHQKPKSRRNARGVAARIARTEDFDDDYTHVCGKIDKVPPPSNLLTNTDNIEFMDTGGEEESSADEFGVKNKFLKNSGYMRFVNPTDEEDEVVTPVVETHTIEHISKENVEEDSNGVETNEDTTTSNSEAVTTIIDSPLDVTKYFQDNLASPTVVAPAQDFSSKTYEEYVRRLQGRISPFSNVRDSIDIRKSKKHSKLIETPKPQNIVEECDQTITSNSSLKLPTSTSKKLEELSRERSKQKDLIHEMVLEKLLAQGKSPQDRKSKRNSRSTPSPRGGLGSQNSITSLAKEEIEKVLTPIEIRALSRSPERPKSISSPERTFKDNKISSPSLERRHSNNQEETEYVDDLATPVVESNDDVFYTPMTSFKIQAENNFRPLSMQSSFRVNQNSNTDTSDSLPVTPLTNPEAFSLPDIRKALFDASDTDFKTPVPPPRLKGADRDQARESARARAKLMSDEELGLSPEDRIKLLKEKVNRRYGRSESDPATSRLTPFFDSYNVSSITEQKDSSLDLKIITPEEEPSLSEIKTPSESHPMKIESDPDQCKLTPNTSIGIHKSESSEATITSPISKVSLVLIFTFLFIRFTGFKINISISINI